MIDKHTLQLLRPDIDAALAIIGAKHNVKLRLGNGSYDPSLGSFKFQLQGQDATGEAPEMILLKKYAQMYWVDLAYLDRDYLSRGRHFRLCGLKMGRSTKALAKCAEDGKVYQFDLRAFKRKDAPSMQIEEVSFDEILRRRDEANRADIDAVTK